MAEFGFKGSKEFIPSIFSNLCKEKVARIFITLYNANVDKELRIPAKFIKNSHSFREIFMRYIEQKLQTNPFKFTKCSRLCPKSNRIIKAYLNREEIPKFTTNPKYKIAKIIDILNTSSEFGIVFDAEDFFKNFVFDKITCKNKNCKIHLKNSMIIIETDTQKLGVIPHFRGIDFTRANYDRDIKDATKHENFEDLSDLYLVYPKAENFRRHIEIRSEKFRENFTMKLVPYCISNKIY